MKTAVFLTMEDPGDFFIYDELTYEPLKSLGWNVVEIPWSKPADDWTKFDAVVIRSTWDYQNRLDEFLNVLGDIERSGVPLFNSLEICKWNATKTYLRDLAERDVPTIPTLWLERYSRESLMSALESFDDSHSIVLKPHVGAGADNIVILDSSADQRWDDAEKIYCEAPIIVQPFLDSIVAVGEFSLFYFGGHYSHAILKTPKSGDFRVQEEHGGIIQSTEPADDLIQCGEQTFDAIEQTLLYGRVDLVRLSDESLAVIEVELIEPSLYFTYDEQSPKRFAHAFDQMTR